MVAMAESVQDQGLSAGTSDFSKEHGDVVGSRREKKAKRYTQFRGVHRTPSGRYGARIWVPSLRANVHLGTFDTADEADKAYDAAAAELRICTPAKAGKKKKQASATPAKKKRAPARPDAWTDFLGVYQLPSGKYGAQIGHSGANCRTWLGTFHAAEDAARAYDEAAVKLHGATAVTKESPMESPMDLVNGFPEMPAVDFLSNSFDSGAQLDDLWADSPPAEQQLVD